MLAALYPTKKALKEQVGQALTYEETSIFGAEYRDDGEFPVVGPSPTKRNWFASVRMKNGIIDRVK